MTYKTLLVDNSDNICTITLNRPDTLNALNSLLIQDLTTALTQADLDKNIRVVIITGSEKAFAAGADFVMLGGMLAGHNEGGGEVIEKFYKTGEWVSETITVDKIERTSWKDAIERKRFVKFYGMSSDAANTKHFGGLKDYRSSEGREVLVPYRGSVLDTIQDLLGGIRSTCTYAGAMKLKQLSKCTTFVRCTQQFNAVYANNNK